MNAKVLFEKLCFRERYSLLSNSDETFNDKMFHKNTFLKCIAGPSSDVYNSLERRTNQQTFTK